jgi:hypothetical protein
MKPRWSLKVARLPAAVRDALSLRRGERVLAHATTRGGSYTVVTADALYLPTPEAGFARLPWERVEHAQWKDGWLHIREVGGGGEHHVGLAEPGAVPGAVQERVTATIVVSQYGALPGGGGVRIVGRRGRDEGEPRWTFVFDAGLDPSDPGLRAPAEQVLEDLRRQTGL